MPLTLVSVPSVPPVTEMSVASKLVPTSSLKVKVRVTVSPAFRLAVLGVMATVGGVVSLTAPGPTCVQFVASAISVLSKPKPPMSDTEYQSWTNHLSFEKDVD